MDVLQKIRKELPSMPQKLAAAGAYVLDNPDRIALESMRGTASAVGVTSTTMLRFARHLGFAGYEEFRQAFQKELLDGGFGSRAGALRDAPDGADAETVASRIFASAETNIRATQTGLNPDDLSAVAAKMRDASSVYLVGSGSLFLVAAIMRSTGEMVLPSLRLIGAEYLVAAEAMTELGPDDVVIGFGMSPTAKRTTDAIQFAQDSGACTVAITDRPSSPLALSAEFAFFCANTSPHYYPSIATLLLTVEALLATVVAEGDGRELERIRLFEQTRKDSGQYFDN